MNNSSEYKRGDIPKICIVDSLNHIQVYFSQQYLFSKTIHEIFINILNGEFHNATGE